MVRAGKGDKDRRTVLPDRIKDDLIKHIESVRLLYDRDRKQGISGVYLPGALEKKYPNTGKEWSWFWLSPSQALSVDSRTLIVRRHHMHPVSLQRAFKIAIQQTGISKQVSVHTLRHYAELRIMPSSFARTQIHQAIDPLRTRHSFDRFGSTEMAGLRNGGSCPVRVKPRLNLRKMPNGKALGLFILF